MCLVRFVILLGLVNWCLLGHGLALSRGLSGSAGLRYAQHIAEENGNQVLDASHFVQQYSILWSTQGKIKKGRVGEYNFSLGYEWSSVDLDIDGEDIDGSKGVIDNPFDKVLFRGDLLLAPGGLPFQMHLFSYDMEHSSLGYQELGELFADQDYDRQSGVASSVLNGSHVTSGLTLVAGVKNGVYSGKFRDLLTAMPKLFIDFRQDEVRDLKGRNPLSYVDRDLAFVSLNKNKNWFHYRFFTHEDRLSPENDFENQTYLIGTIDHVNRRQWIDLTNWIQVSTDLSYSETSPGGRSREDHQKRYDYNLFTSAQRSDWEGAAYTSFSRIRDDRSLEKRLSVPILANGRLNRESTWRVRIENQHEQEDYFETGSVDTESNLFLSGRLDMFSQSRYMVSPVLEAEYKEGARSDGYALRLGAEGYSNKRYRSDSEVFGSYLLSFFDGTSSSGAETSYWEQQLLGRYSKDLNSDLRAGAEQELIYGSGDYASDVADFIRADVSILPSVDQSGTQASGSYYRTISHLFVDHRPASRVYNRFSFTYDYVSSSVDSGGQFSVGHNLNYYGRDLKAAVSTELIIGTSLHESFGSDTDVEVIGGTSLVRQSGTVVSSLESDWRLDYSPDRSRQHALDVELEWREFEIGGSDQRYKVTQLYEYTFWKDRGLLRKVASLGEEIEYENYTPSSDESSSLFSCTLFSEFYPTRQTLLGLRLRYELDTTSETDTLLMFFSAGIDFEKFQLEFDYAYGTRTAGLSQPERIEHKWEMQVKKIF